MNIINTLHQEAQRAFQQKQYALAHQKIIEILQQDKFFADGYFLLGMIASVHNNISKAISLIEQALKLAPANIQYLAYLAKHLSIAKQDVAAFNALEKLPCTKHITNALTLDTIGVAYAQIGRHHNAAVFFQQAVNLEPKNDSFQFNLAASLKFIGEIDAAKETYLATIQLNPQHYKAHFALSSLGGVKNKQARLKHLNGLFLAAEQANDKLYIGHALAKEYEALAEYEKSFEALSAAKEKKLALLNSSLADDKKIFDALFEQFQKASVPKQGFDSDEAIFVVGMPRTGTTLVERILSSHNKVSSAGELQNFGLLLKAMSKTQSAQVIDTATINAAHHINFQQLGQAYLESTRALTGKAAKFVDKMPLNFLYVGYILQALPKAKIICLDRNPLDTIVSNFKQLFAVNQSYYNYSYSLEWTTEYYKMFKQLIHLWQMNYSDNFYLVNYEKLVQHPEQEAKQLVEFAGLSWQPQCLDIEKNLSPVATASAAQVRSPINNKSVGFWQHYQAFLQDIIPQFPTKGS